MVRPETLESMPKITYNTAAVITAAALLAIGGALYIAFELTTHSMFYALPVTLGFAAFFAFPALILLRRSPRRLQFVLIGSYLVLILVVRNVEWNTRKPFLRALETVHAGMTVEQVDTAMRGFVRSPQAGLSEAGTVGFRHTDAGWGDADVGLVTLAGGHVVRVEYLAD